MSRTLSLDAPQALPWRAGLAYGLLGLPLAFAALPLYVVLPHYYTNDLGLPLATVGALLLLVRLMDAVTDPLLGLLSDRLYRRSVHAVLWMAGVCALLLGGGMAGLFFPLVQGPTALAAWMVAGLLFTCLAHSLLVIGHQSWGVRLGGDAVQRSRIVAWREGPGLLGVIAASALSVAWGQAPCWRCSGWRCWRAGCCSGRHHVRHLQASRLSRAGRAISRFGSR